MPWLFAFSWVCRTSVPLASATLAVIPAKAGIQLLCLGSSHSLGCVEPRFRSPRRRAGYFSFGEKRSNQEKRVPGIRADRALPDRFPAVLAAQRPANNSAIAGSLHGRIRPGCEARYAVHFSAASWPVEPPRAGEASKNCPRASGFSPRTFLPCRLPASDSSPFPAGRLRSSALLQGGRSRAKPEPKTRPEPKPEPKPEQQPERGRHSFPFVLRYRRMNGSLDTRLRPSVRLTNGGPGDQSPFPSASTRSGISPSATRARSAAPASTSVTERTTRPLGASNRIE